MYMHASTDTYICVCTYNIYVYLYNIYIYTYIYIPTCMTWPLPGSISERIGADAQGRGRAWFSSMNIGTYHSWMHIPGHTLSKLFVSG